MTALKVGDSVRYEGDLPGDWAREGEVIATDGEVATVEFADGHRQDIPEDSLRQL